MCTVMAAIASGIDWCIIQNLACVLIPKLHECFGASMCCWLCYPCCMGLGWLVMACLDICVVSS